MEMLDRVDDLWDLIEHAKALPLSQSCIVPRDEALDLLEDVRASLPAAIQEAEQVVRRRDDILDDAVRESEAVVAAARDEGARIMEEATRSANRIRSDAQHEAERIIAEARTQAAHMLEHHTISVAAKDEAVRVLARAQEQAGAIVESTQRSAAERLQEVAQALAAAMSDVREGIATLNRAPEAVEVDFDLVGGRGQSHGAGAEHPFDEGGRARNGYDHAGRGGVPYGEDSYGDDGGPEEPIFDLEADGGLEGARRARVYY